ncbi:hypothetical protein ABS71_19445 [bacterium SCN 62-11]|nr:MAG: hypothetical protein ABS71_19445 [bacterium SCN 62-11]
MPRITISLGQHFDDAQAFFSELLLDLIQALKASAGCLFLSGEQSRWRYCLGRDAQGAELPEEIFLCIAGQECLSRARGSQQSVILRNWLGSPLLVHGECVGVLCLQRGSQVGDFTMGEGQLVDCASRQACLALIQARLRQQLAGSEQALQEERERRISLQDQCEGLRLHALMACHELQAPLRGLVGLAQIALQSPPGHEDLERSLQGIGQAASRLHDLQESLLQYCRASSLPLARQRVSSSAILTGACQDLHPLLTSTQADFQRDGLPWCDADPSALRSIFRALLQNALTFRRSRPRLEVSFRNGTFRVRDDGPGIPPAQFERVFEPFVRLHARAEYPGSGLGLAICRLLVRRHRGRIWLEENSDGPGITVCFTMGEQA